MLPESFYKISNPVSVAIAKYSCVWLDDIPFTAATWGVLLAPFVSFNDSIWASLYLANYSSSIWPFFVLITYRVSLPVASEVGAAIVPKFAVASAYSGAADSIFLFRINIILLN